MSVINTSGYSGPYTGNGVTTTFPFSFIVATEEEVGVLTDGAVAISGYTVEVSNNGSGQVVFDVAPAVGVEIIPYSEPLFTQTTTFENAGAFLASTHDRVADRATMRDIYLKTRVAAAIRVPIGETLDPLPRASLRAGKFAAFDAEGRLIAASGEAVDGALRTDLAAAAGAALIGFARSEAGAASRSMQTKLRDSVFAEDFGAVGDGVTDDTAHLQAALNTGKIVFLKKNATYLITSGLQHISGAGLVGNGGVAKLKAKTGVGGFAVTDTAAPRTGTDRNMLIASGTDDLTIRDVHFTLDEAAEVVLHGIRLYGGMATEGYDIDASFSKFDIGSMVALGGVGGGKLRNVRVRSAVDSGITQGLARFTAGAQTTVVEIDNDKPSATASVGGNIQIDLIKDVLYSGQALTDFGQQTDGLNIIGQGADSTSNWSVVMGVVNGVGEPVDIQGWRNTIRIGTIKNAYNDAVKLIHGAQHNNITVGTVEASGRSAVYIAGSATLPTDRDTKGNTVRVGSVVNPGSYGIGLTGAAGDAAVVVFANSNSTYKPVNNFVEVGSVVGDGVNLDYVVKDGGAGANNENLVEVGKASGFAVGSTSAPHTNVRVRYGGRCFTELTMSAAQNIVSATATKVAFNTASIDLEGIAVTASNKVTPKWPGLYRVRAQLRLDGWMNAAQDKWQLEVRQNASAIAISCGRIEFSPGKDQTVSIEKLVHIRETDIGTANADLTIWLTQDVGADRSVSNAAAYTFFSVERVS